MAVDFLRPGRFDPARQIDDQYLAIVQRYGESTEPSAQLQAIGACGLTAEFRQDGTIDDLIAQLERGIPAPVGWLLQGGRRTHGCRALECRHWLGSKRADCLDA